MQEPRTFPAPPARRTLPGNGPRPPMPTMSLDIAVEWDPSSDVTTPPSARPSSPQIRARIWESED